ncbi:MAG: hypothetical protein WCK89_06945 [bacterium]
MSEDETNSAKPAIIETFSVTPPFIWPDSRDMSGVSACAQTPPGKEFFVNADLISGVIVGASVETVNWIKNVLRASEEKRLCLILILHPAGPTHAEHLKSLLTAISANDGGKAKADIRLRTMTNWLAADGEHITLPPTAIQYHSTKTGRTLMSIGSTGDVGHDLIDYGSLNLVFYPDDAVRDEWRRWFQYMFEISARLIPETCEIPQLLPAKGDPKADLLWWEYAALCSKHTSSDDAKPTVDAQTGEVTKTADGKAVVAWDGGVTALDPLASIFQKLYADSWLVTVDETTRLKPVKIPVKATLLGQQPERAIGAVTQKQSFTLQVLDDSVEKEVENCRTVTDLLQLLAFHLSKGNRLLPNTTKALLEKEVASREKRGKKALWSALIGPQAELNLKKGILDALHKLGFGKAVDSLIKRPKTVSQKLDSENEIVQAIIDSDTDEDAALKAALVQEHVRRIIVLKRESITEDLNQMYRELGQGDRVPTDKLNAVLEDVRSRLTNALSQRITPRPVYNRIGAPDLTSKAPDENWNQPLMLLTRSAQSLRESITDRYFQQKFKGLAFTAVEYAAAMDVFGDVIVKTPTKRLAQNQLCDLEEILKSQSPAKQKCQALWNLIKDNPPPANLNTAKGT